MALASMKRRGHPEGMLRAPRTCACGQCVGPWYRLVAAVAAWVLLFPCNLNSQKSKATEYDVKAAYLFNFARFAEWQAGSPAARNDTFAICVLGQDPFRAALDALVTGETIAGKAVVARRITKPQEAVNCRVLFISSSEDSRLQEILGALDGACVLTVSDMPQFTRRGGMIQFVTDGSKIRFEINLANAGVAGLTLSSELLKVAVTVIRNSQPGV
jgi:uncharacterized protein DUF4154